ncbi:MAG: helix-turn-helix domain-containing protein [Actinomycetia bacterium]|nr:helix-turn-helix domain-containing protein [Actinomycetes bacterium]
MKCVRREREARQWSRSELARRAGMANSTIGAIESGRLNPYPSQLHKIARALKYSGEPETLLDEVGADGSIR